MVQVRQQILSVSDTTSLSLSIMALMKLRGEEDHVGILLNCFSEHIRLVSRYVYSERPGVCVGGTVSAAR